MVVYSNPRSGFAQGQIEKFNDEGVNNLSSLAMMGADLTQFRVQDILRTEEGESMEERLKTHLDKVIELSKQKSNLVHSGAQSFRNTEFDPRSTSDSLLGVAGREKPAGIPTDNSLETQYKNRGK